MLPYHLDKPVVRPWESWSILLQWKQMPSPYHLLQKKCNLSTINGCCYGSMNCWTASVKETRVWTACTRRWQAHYWADSIKYVLRKWLHTCVSYKIMVSFVTRNRAWRWVGRFPTYWYDNIKSTWYYLFPQTKVDQLPGPWIHSYIAESVWGWVWLWHRPLVIDVLLLEVFVQDVHVSQGNGVSVQCLCCSWLNQHHLWLMYYLGLIAVKLYSSTVWLLSTQTWMNVKAPSILG